MKELFLHTEETGYRYESEILYDEDHRFAGWVIKEIDDSDWCHEVRFNKNGVIISELWTEPWEVFNGKTLETSDQPTLLIEYHEDGGVKRKTVWELQQEEGYGTDWNCVIYDGENNILIDTRW